MSIGFSHLLPLGWSNFFSIQIPLDKFATVRPARVVRVERGRFWVDLGDEQFFATLAGRLFHQTDAPVQPAVGDWVLLDADQPVIEEVLERQTVIARREAGGVERQVIAANIDLMVVVSGLDGDYNLHRIERYLVMAAQSGVTPLVLLTKADLADDPVSAVAGARERLGSDVEVIAVNALEDSLAERLGPWLDPGRTLVVVGSSGAGKSTVVNNLAGESVQATGTTRRDAKGRHTTTSRSLIRLPGGACIIDVPGMREVGLTGGEGVERRFRSINELARDCRFTDCTHQEEPGCAVRSAVETGDVDADEWAHYHKLLAEERHNLAEHERRRRERVFGKMVRKVVLGQKREGRR